MVRCSICIATHNRATLLTRTLTSIVRQTIPFDWELIVVDDGSVGSFTRIVCSSFSRVKYLRIDRGPEYRNPSVARNVAYRAARGDIVICQSDDVIHHSENCVRELVDQLRPKTFLLATVVNVDRRGKVTSNKQGTGYGDKLEVYVSPQKKRPLFFLGSLYREDLYAVGGNDEEFAAPSGEDRWFGMCLMKGLGLQPVYSADIVGHHQVHDHCDPSVIGPSQNLLQKKVAAARAGGQSWCSSGGSWSYP